MAGLMVRLFGKLSVSFTSNGTSGDGVVRIESRKAQELFCYLLVYRNQAHPREALASLIWGDHTTDRSKKYFRHALWQIQSSLAPSNGSVQPPLLLIDADRVQINPQADVWLDVAEFEQACILAQKNPTNELLPEDFLHLKKAANLYQEDLLEGWYTDWCLYERERLQNSCVTLLDKLMAYCEWHTQYEEALEYGTQILRLDVAHERTHRRMMRIYYMSGERTTALRQYQRCVISLKDELGVDPALKTIELYERIRGDQASIGLPRLDTKPPALSNDMLLWRLTQLKKTLVTFQTEALAEINAIENMLNGSDPQALPPTLDTISNQNKTL